MARYSDVPVDGTDRMYCPSSMDAERLAQDADSLGLTLTAALLRHLDKLVQEQKAQAEAEPSVSRGSPRTYYGVTVTRAKGALSSKHDLNVESMAIDCQEARLHGAAALLWHLDEKLAQAEQQLRTETQKNTSLTRQVEELEKYRGSVFARTQEMTAAHKAECDALHTELTVVRGGLQASKDKASEMTRVADARLQELDRLRASYRSLEADRDGWERKYRAFSDELGKAQSALAAMTHRGDEARKEVRKREEELAEIKKQLICSNKNAAEQAQVAADRFHTISKLKDELEAAKKSAADHAKVAADWFHENCKLKAELEVANRSLAGLEKTVQSQTQRLANQGKTIRKLSDENWRLDVTRKVDDSTDASEDAAEEARALEHTLKRTQAKLQTVEYERETLILAIARLAGMPPRKHACPAL